MGSLADRLNQPTARESEYRPKTEFDGRTGFIQTGPLETAPKSHTEILELFGYDPAEVRIVGTPRVSKWQTYDELEAAVNELVQAVEWVAHPHDHTPDTATIEAAADHLAERLEGNHTHG